MNDRNWSRLQGAEIEFPGLTKGKTRRKVRYIKTKADLNVEFISERVKEIRIRWYECTKRIDEKRLTGRMVEEKVQGTRSRKQSRTSWKDGVKRSVERKDSNGNK